MYSAKISKIPAVYPQLLPSFAPSIYTIFTPSDGPRSSPTTAPSYIPGLILWHDQSLILSSLYFHIPGPSIIPSLEISSHYTNHPTLIPTLHVHVSLKKLRTTLYWLYFVWVGGVIRDKRPTCLVWVQYRSNIDTTENIHVVILSLSEVRNVDRPVFQDLFGAL